MAKKAAEVLRKAEDGAGADHEKGEAASAPCSPIGSPRTSADGIKLEPRGVAPWEVRDLKAGAHHLKSAISKTKSSGHVDQMIDNAVHHGLDYSTIMGLCSGLHSWTKSRSGYDYADSAIASLASAKDKHKFLQEYAEAANAIAQGHKAGFKHLVKHDGPGGDYVEHRPGTVHVNAVEGRGYDLGDGKKHTIDPVPEADAFFHGYDGNLHLQEVKNTPQAFFDKIADHPRQFERLVEWQGGGKGRQAAINIRTAEGFGMLFGIERYKQKDVLGTIQGLLERGVHITVGGKPFAEVRDMFQRKA